jgi:hypothetical protein
MPADQVPPNAPPPSTDPVELEISGGIKVKMTPAEAEAYKAATKKHKDHADNLARQVGSIQAEKDAAEAKARQEADSAAALKLAKEGEMGKLKELLTRESNERLSQLGGSIVAGEIKAAIATQLPGLDATALTDTVTLITQRARFNTEQARGEYLDEAGQLLVVEGKPAGADALVRDFLSKRPHLKPVTVPAGLPPTSPPTPARVATNEDMAQGRVNPDDVLSGKVVIRN